MQNTELNVWQAEMKQLLVFVHSIEQANLPLNCWAGSTAVHDEGNWSAAPSRSLSLQVASSTPASLSRSSSHALFPSCLCADATSSAAPTLSSACGASAPTKTWWRKWGPAWPTLLSRKSTSPPPAVRPSPPKSTSSCEYRGQTFLLHLRTKRETLRWVPVENSSRLFLIGLFTLEVRVLLRHASIKPRGGVVNLESGGFDPIKAQNQSGFLALRARRRCRSSRYTSTCEHRKVGLHLKAVSLYGCQVHRQFCHQVAVETPFGPELGKKKTLSSHCSSSLRLHSLWEGVRQSIVSYWNVKCFVCVFEYSKCTLHMWLMTWKSWAASSEVMVYMCQNEK